MLNLPSDASMMECFCKKNQIKLFTLLSDTKDVSLTVSKVINFFAIIQNYAECRISIFIF